MDSEPFELEPMASDEEVYEVREVSLTCQTTGCLGGTEVAVKGET